MNKIKIFGMGLAALALASCSTPQKPAVDTAKPVEPVSSAKRLYLMLRLNLLPAAVLMKTSMFSSLSNMK